ncbi:hypothetical protein INQ51_08365 [Maribellus sp. CM-23]|uniref:hypothetical protein n=1 Tax=Maribellus sp. CM-23 TaxID=2781026 RepID=UPI001F2E6A03|nr:hypothetical protein [Maribellus sp. CM-23]MCE4564324.1 hypothetical protein [Maribellus sp. CM-23]
MIRNYFLPLVLIFLLKFSYAQESETTSFPEIGSTRSAEPFLFSTSTLTARDAPWVLSYGGSYGNNLSRGFGFNGVDQQLGVKGYLGRRFTMLTYVSLGVASADNSVVSAQRAEIIRDLVGGKKTEGLRLGIGGGLSRDYGGVFSVVCRTTGALESRRWKLAGNLLFEKALSGNRDKVDVLTSLGVQYKITDHFFAGVEAIGEDLEGLWEEEEAEGGARMMFGPSLNLVPDRSRFSFSLSGGPAVYLTRSVVTNPDAIRDLPGENGMTVRARVIFSLSGS